MKFQRSALLVGNYFFKIAYSIMTMIRKMKVTVLFGVNRMDVFNLHEDRHVFRLNKN